MRARVDEEDALVGRLAKVLLEALEIEADRCLVVVAVRPRLDPDIFEDGRVVGPRRVRDVDGLGALGEGVEASEEKGAEVVGACARDGLRPVLSEWRGRAR